MPKRLRSNRQVIVPEAPRSMSRSNPAPMRANGDQPVPILLLRAGSNV